MGLFNSANCCTLIDSHKNMKNSNINTTDKNLEILNTMIAYNNIENNTIEFNVAIPFNVPNPHNNIYARNVYMK